MAVTARKTLNLVVAGLCVVGLIQSARGQEQTRPESLESRIERLEQTLSTLERRIADLEGAQQPRQAVTPVIVKWQQLRQGMTADDVRRTVGEPLAVDAGPLLIYWFYSQTGTVGPHVIFNAGSMTVKGWREP